MTLNDITVGTVAVIVSVEGPYKEHIMSIGFIPGHDVKKIRIAKGRSVYELAGNRLAIRDEDAVSVNVKV